MFIQLNPSTLRSTTARVKKHATQDALDTDSRASITTKNGLLPVRHTDGHTSSHFILFLTSKQRMESTGRESSTNALIEKDFDRETSRSSKYRFPSSREGCFCIPHNNTKRPAREIHSVGKLPACFIALRVSGTQDQSSLLNIHWHSSCARNRENHQCVSSDFRPSYENVPTAFKKQQLDPPPPPLSHPTPNCHNYLTCAQFGLRWFHP